MARSGRLIERQSELVGSENMSESPQKVLDRIQDADIVLTTYSVVGFNADKQSYTKGSAEDVIHTLLITNVMAFCDEIHTVVGAGAAEGSMD